MNQKQNQGVKRLIAAFGYSLEGLSSAWQGEKAFRLEVILTAVAVPTALFMPVSSVGKALMIGSLMLVLVAELLNSAIEAAVDRVSPDRHPLSKRAKDMGSAAVFITLLNVVIIWGLLLFK